MSDSSAQVCLYSARLEVSNCNFSVHGRAEPAGRRRRWRAPFDRSLCAKYRGSFRSAASWSRCVGAPEEGRKTEQRRRILMPHLGRVLIFALLTTSTVGSVLAQGGNGQIEGTIKDEQGSVLPGLTVTMRNQESGVTRMTVTGPDGHYRFPALSPGSYS